MKVWIAGVLFDASKEPIVLVWDNDNERKTTGAQITNMPDNDGIRQYCQYPTNIPDDEAQVLMDKVEDKVKRVNAAILSRATNTGNQGVLLVERLSAHDHQVHDTGHSFALVDVAPHHAEIIPILGHGG